MTKQEMTGHQAEFGHAMTASRTLRTALGDLLTNISDNKMAERLNRIMMQVLQTDNINSKGNRKAACGNLDMLRDFNFNEKRKFHCTFFSRISESTDRIRGQMQLIIPGFDPRVMITMPDSATHFKLYSAGLEIDFGSGQYVISIQQTPLVSRYSTYIDTITHIHSVTPNSTKALVLVQGIKVCNVTNCRQYTVGNGNSLVIVSASAAGE